MDLRELIKNMEEKLEGMTNEERERIVSGMCEIISTDQSAHQCTDQALPQA